MNVIIKALQSRFTKQHIVVTLETVKDDLVISSCDCLMTCEEAIDKMITI